MSDLVHSPLGGEQLVGAVTNTEACKPDAIGAIPVEIMPPTPSMAAPNKIAAVECMPPEYPMPPEPGAEASPRRLLVVDDDDLPPF
jgi:hypothetical protein